MNAKKWYADAPHPLKCAAILVAALALGGCASLVDQYKRTLSQSEVRALFTRHTVTSVNVDSGKRSITYYTPSRVRQIRDGSVRTGTWRVKRNGLKCMTMGTDPEVCRFVRRDEDGVYRKYKPGFIDTQPTVYYESFVPGNQLNRARSARGSERAAPGSQQAGLSPAQVRRVQQHLADAGYSPGPVDGVWGPRSRAAQSRYQSERGLAITGAPDPSLLR